MSNSSSSPKHQNQQSESNGLDSRKIFETDNMTPNVMPNKSKGLGTYPMFTLTDSNRNRKSNICSNKEYY